MVVWCSMTYELWQLVTYGEGEPPTPLFKIAESKEFEDIYRLFMKEVKTKLCVIVLQKEGKN